MDPLTQDMMVDSDYDEKHLTPNDMDDNVVNISPDDAESMAEDTEPISEPPLPSAEDHQAMIARFMPEPPDTETEAEVVSTWDITNWRQLSKKEHGPIFKCGDHPWRVLFFPAGNSAAESVSFYLEHGFGEGDDKPPEDWYACAQFMLVLSNPHDPSIYTYHVAQHRFTADEGDWGFTRFGDKNQLFAAKYKDHDRPLVEGDAARMTAYVRVLKDPTGVLWHSFHNYDSKKETGMVGLRNQGATCYLNSLLQSLYLTGAFRKAVYQIPTESEQDRASSNSAYALQRLFYRLQADPTAVSTQELTHSFGWESRQIFEQQDVQELSRILMDKLENRMKGTEAENALNNMFVGKMKTYLKCINVDYESSRIEDFWDLQLNVSGCKSLDDSFRDYIQVETLEGDNKYQAEGYGLQDAKKGVIFEAFPSVLHLQLKRFEYDFQRDAMMKVNDRYEFPEVWDASPYLDEAADRSEPYIYRLHGVLVHSGDLNAGHYYAFLKPEKDGHFYRFDDDRVTRATTKEAIDDNFGGDYTPTGVNGATKGQNPYTRQWSTKRSNNAYMLVYVRESKLDHVLLPETAVQPPEHLPAKILEERALAEKRRKEREEAHLYMNVAVASLTNFSAYQGADLIPWTGDPETEPAAPKIYRLLRSMTISDFTKYIADAWQKDVDLIRPWIMVNRQNGTVRPDHPLQFPDMSLQEAADKFSTRHSGFRVFIEETTRSEDGRPEWLNDDTHSIPSSPGVNGNPNLAQQLSQPPQKPIIIFLKHFDIDRQTLHGVGHIYMYPSDKVQDMAPNILTIMDWEVGTELELYEEIKQNYVEQMKPKSTLVVSELQDGDIVVFQRHISDAEPAAIKETNPAAILTVKAYYDYLVNRMFVHFSSKLVPPQNVILRTEEDEKFTIAFSKKDSYETLAAKVAEHLTSVSSSQVDAGHIRFTTSNPQSGKPRAIVKPQATTTVGSILLANGGYGYNYPPNQATDHLFYEVLEMSLKDLEQRKVVRIFWLTDGITKEEQVDLLVPKQGNFSDVLAGLGKKLQLPDEALEQVRFYEVHSGKIYKLLPTTTAVLALNEFMTVYAERIPEEERGLNRAPAEDKMDEGSPGQRVACAFHFEKEPSKHHSVPFYFVVNDDEVMADTIERLSKRTGIKGKSWEKVRFAVIKGGQSYSRPVWLEDGDILAEKLGPDDHLGLEHPNRNKSNWVRYESLNIR